MVLREESFAALGIDIMCVCLCLESRLAGVAMVQLEGTDTQESSRQTWKNAWSTEQTEVGQREEERKLGAEKWIFFPSKFTLRNQVTGMTLIKKKDRISIYSFRNLIALSRFLHVVYF